VKMTRGEITRGAKIRAERGDGEELVSTPRNRKGGGSGQGLDDPAAWGGRLRMGHSRQFASHRREEIGTTRSLTPLLKGKKASPLMSQAAGGETKETKKRMVGAKTEAGIQGGCL